MTQGRRDGADIVDRRRGGLRAHPHETTRCSKGNKRRRKYTRDQGSTAGYYGLLNKYQRNQRRSRSNQDQPRSRIKSQEIKGSRDQYRAVRLSGQVRRHGHPLGGSMFALASMSWQLMVVSGEVADTRHTQVLSTDTQSQRQQ